MKMFSVKTVAVPITVAIGLGGKPMQSGNLPELLSLLFIVFELFYIHR